MEEKTLNVLEFDKVLEKVEGFARAGITKEKIRALRPDTDYLDIEEELDYTDQMIKTIAKLGRLDIYGLYDFSEIISYVRKKGVLEPADLLKVGDFLRLCSYLKEYGEGVEEERIKNLFDRLLPENYIKNEIERSILSEEEIADDASGQLRSIRRKIVRKEEEVKNKLKSYVTSSRYDDTLQDKLITIRDGRYVLPVKVEKKNNLRGIVHDKSASGSTIFVEPNAVIELNNQLSDLLLEEEAEIRRILDRLSRLVEGFDQEILEDQKLVSRLDFLQAKASFALENEYTRPTLTEERIIDLKEARHPLLKGRVVPIDVKIGGSYTTLIITGPNTGGKTVSLKTVGLISAMAQAGLFIPCAEGSSLTIFDNIFVDIGDLQSIEMSLSSFSASLTNIVDILDKVDEKSMVLLDEIGSGTDPVEGSALAISILDHLTQRGILTFATTHYSELKYYAIENPKVMNASVQFNVETLSPTYKLIIGSPGKSNAFEISRRLGLKGEILSRAQEIMGEDEKNLENILGQMEEKNLALEEKNKEIDSYKRDIEIYKDRLSQKERELAEREEKILEDAQKKANQILDEANEKSQDMLKEAKKSLKANTSGLDRSLNNIRNIYKTSRKEDESENLGGKTVKGHPKTLKAGEVVYLAGLKEKAIVLEGPDQKGNIKVQMGILKMDTNIKKVVKLDEEDPSQKQVKQVYNAKKAMGISPKIDLRGQRYDEAMRNVDKYLDDALLANLDFVTIIHGKGTGALRAGINEMLKTDKRVKSFRPGNDKEGGFGVTVVSFK